MLDLAPFLQENSRLSKLLANINIRPSNLNASDRGFIRSRQPAISTVTFNISADYFQSRSKLDNWGGGGG